MANIFALLRSDGSLLYVRRKGARWVLVERKPDSGARGRHLCVFVPGTDVLALDVNIPARNEAEARRAAPFAVEDEVAEAAEIVHVALGPKPETLSAKRTIHVVSQARMEAWVECLQSHGVPEAALVASHDLLPAENGLYEIGDTVLGRVSGRSFALEKSVGADVFLGIIDGDEAVPVYGETLAAAMRVVPAGAGVQTGDEALLTQLADWAGSRELLNLRQARFRIRSAVDLKGVARWRVAAGLAAAALMGWLALVVLQTNGMKARSATLESRAIEFVEAGWPAAGSNPQTVLSDLQTERRARGSAFPPALTAIAIVYASIEAVPGSQLRSLRYDRTRGQLAAIVTFESFDGADMLAKLIEETGLQVRAGDARQSGNRVISELTLEAAP